jgi:DNA-binding transcriptional LysR family regulator
VLPQITHGVAGRGFRTGLAAGRLLPVLPGWSLTPSPMYLIYPQDLRPTAKLRSAIDFLVERFGLAVRSD